MLKSRRTSLILLLSLLALGAIAVFAYFLYTRHLRSQRVAERKREARTLVQSMISQSSLHSGDIVFQTSLSRQSKAVQQATHSKYSHCGIVYFDGNDAFVIEAVQPVKKTSLEDWIARGQDGHFDVKRLKDAARLTPQVLSRMRAIGESFMGKSYDLTFEWSDDKMYCSELVWKMYERGAGITLSSLERLNDFDLTSPEVKQIMSERYGDKIPLSEYVVSPAALFASEQLEEVQRN